MISDEQTEKIKKQIIQHIEENFPEERKTDSIEKVNSMSAEELGEFLKQNNLVKSQEQGRDCIFCMISQGKIPSNKITESDEAVSVLEINPISKGHNLVIPKKHSNPKKLPREIINFSEDVSSRIKEKLNPKEIISSETHMFGHKILNLIPVYNDETINSKRYSAKKEELEEIKKILTGEMGVKKKEKIEGKVAKKQEVKETYRLPRRIP